jgi:uncharacterized protein (TIGR02217 family)
MSFSEVRLPTAYSYGSGGGPEYSTAIIEVLSGHEQRISRWAQGRGRWQLGYAVRTRAQLVEILTFFRARRGSFQGFRFKDPLDYSVATQQIGTGTGTQTQYQLIKSYQSGTDLYQRTITKPIQTSVVMYVNGVPQGVHEGGNFLVDHTTGIVTFTTPPASGVDIKADFEFDVPVRFVKDRLDISLEQFNLGQAPDIEIIEIRT